MTLSKMPAQWSVRYIYASKAVIAILLVARPSCSVLNVLSHMKSILFKPKAVIITIGLNFIFQYATIKLKHTHSNWF